MLVPCTRRCECRMQLICPWFSIVKRWVMKSVPSHLRGPFRKALRMSLEETSHTDPVRAERARTLFLSPHQIASSPTAWSRSGSEAQVAGTFRTVRKMTMGDTSPGKHRRNRDRCTSSQQGRTASRTRPGIGQSMRDFICPDKFWKEQLWLQGLKQR